MTPGRLSIGLLVLIGLLIAVLVSAPGCAGPRHVRLSFDQLDDLEACVRLAPDEVERQNCVERLYPKGHKP